MPSILNNLLNPETRKHHKVIETIGDIYQKADNSLGFDFTDLQILFLK